MRQNFIHRIAQDDASVKLLFDHVRNVGISAVLFGAAFWKYKNIGPDYIYFLDIAIILFLTLLSSFLFVVNQVHGLIKLKAAQPPKWVLLIILNIYSLIAVTVVMAIVGVKL